jgi:hypothetical protein
MAVGGFRRVRSPLVNLGLRCELDDSAGAYQEVNDNERSDEMQVGSSTVQCRR